MTTITILLQDCKESDFGQRCNYSYGLGCPLALAINRILKSGYYAQIGCIGYFTIRKQFGKIPERWNSRDEYVFNGQVENFNIGVVKSAKADFIREINIPQEYLLSQNGV